MNDEFHGVIAALVTPYAPNGEFNEKAYRKLMECCIMSGVDGFWIAGGTGESVLLSEDEVKNIAQVSSDQSAGRVKTVIHVGALTTASAVKMAVSAREAGVDAISCVPPFFYHPSDQAVINHFRAVAEAADLPFFVYNQPNYTGVEILPQLMESLCSVIPKLVGVKHSAPDFRNIRKFSAMDIAVFTGSGSLFLPALATGAAGVVDGPITIAPEIWVDLYRAYRDGDIQRAQMIQERARQLIDLVGQFGMQASCKALVQERWGIDCGVPRLPIPSLNESLRNALVSAVKDLGFLETSEKV